MKKLIKKTIKKNLILFLEKNNYFKHKIFFRNYKN